MYEGILCYENQVHTSRDDFRFRSGSEANPIYLNLESGSNRFFLGEACNRIELRFIKEMMRSNSFCLDE